MHWLELTTGIVIIYLLLAFIRATRTGNWKLYLDSLRLMLPWMFAYDNTLRQVIRPIFSFYFYIYHLQSKIYKFASGAVQ